MDGFAACRALQDHWYVVASTAIAAPTAVRPLGRPYVIWRDAEGGVRAAADRCPHREAPLSCGTIDDDALTCAYHGWRFGAGRATEVPRYGFTDLDDDRVGYTYEVAG